MEKHLSLSFQIPSQKSFSKHTFPPFEPEGSSCKEQSRATIIHQFFQLIEGSDRKFKLLESLESLYFVRLERTHVTKGNLDPVSRN